MSMRRRNPLSNKRRFFLEETYARRYRLDTDSLKGVSEKTVADRKAELSRLLDWLSEADPSVSGKYAMWIAKLHKKQLIQFPEDIEKINDRLQKFEKVKHLLPVEKRDINHYKTYGDLARVLDEHSGVGVREAVRVATAEGQEVIFDKGKYRVIKVTTLEAASKLARNTEWCVKDPKWGITYLEWGPLYFIDKGNKRYALAWRGRCDKRYERYTEFKKFVDASDSRGLCYFCQKTGCRDSHDDASIESQDFIYAYEDYENGFNQQFTKEYVYPDKDTPQHLQDFVSRSECVSGYSVLGVYDDRLDLHEMRQIRPLLLMLFNIDIATDSREELKDFYESILLTEPNKTVERSLLQHKDVSKILDYLEVAETSKRWKEAEKLIFQDAAKAAHYYMLIQDTLTERDKKDLRKLGKDIPKTKKPKKPKIETDKREHRWANEDFKNKKTEAGYQIERIRDKLDIDKQKYEAKIEKMHLADIKNENRLMSAIDRAIADADRGVPVETTVPRILKAAKVGSGSDYSEGSELREFIVDFVAYYNKGFIVGSNAKPWKTRKRWRGRRRRSAAALRRKGDKKRMYSGEYAASHPSRFLITKSYSGGRSRKKKIKQKVDSLAAFANRKISRRRRSMRRYK
jgi:hypothetical protein